MHIAVICVCVYVCVCMCVCVCVCVCQGQTYVISLDGYALIRKTSHMHVVCGGAGACHQVRSKREVQSTANCEL